MTTGDLVKASPIANDTYDTALPQEWVDDVKLVTGVSPAGQIVWWYSKDSTWGRPYPLTPFAAYVLMCYTMKVRAL